MLSVDSLYNHTGHSGHPPSSFLEVLPITVSDTLLPKPESQEAYPLFHFPRYIGLVTKLIQFDLTNFSESIPLQPLFISNSN